MREQSLIDLEQSPLVVDEEIQDVGLVPSCEVADLDSVLGELGQSEQTLFELLRFFRALVELLELLSVVDLVLQATFHDLFADLLDALDE